MEQTWEKQDLGVVGWVLEIGREELQGPEIHSVEIDGGVQRG